jgi:hypothetical protein
MSLKIRSIREKGILEKERIVLASESRDDIGKYILFSTSYNEDDTVSSMVRETLWLPDYQVEAGDLVVVYTKASREYIKEKKNDDNTKTVFIYWGKDHTVWNQGMDCAVLIKIDEWSKKKI